MGKSNPQSPTPPDPTATGLAQTNTNIGTAIAQKGLNNTNIIGPTGSQTFNQTGGYTDPQTGQWVPQYTENIQLGPLGQQLLAGQGGVASSWLPAIQGEAANIQPLDIQGGASGAIANAGPQALAGNVANAAYGEQAGFLNPQWQQQQKDVQDQLSRQGIPVGSDAYNNAMTQFQNSKTQAYQAASQNAIQQGMQGAQGMFGLALQGQGQNVALQQAAQQNPMKLLSLLSSGQGTA